MRFKWFSDTPEDPSDKVTIIHEVEVHPTHTRLKKAGKEQSTT